MKKTLLVELMPKKNWREFGNPSPYEGSQKLFNIQSKAEQAVRVKKTRGGKGGKTVTLIHGLELDAVASKNLLKSLKVKCGTGGTFKDNILELQGDKVKEVLLFLTEAGYNPKQSGG